MARVLGLEDTPSALRSALSASLRVVDEATVLPAGSRSKESGSFKNVVFRLAGDEPDLSAEIFSSSWFAGVSVVKLPASAAAPLLKDSKTRQRALERLKAAIPSEMSDSNLTVGPDLDCDEFDRDTDAWTAGFDGPTCCVGLYSTSDARVPHDCGAGTERAHEDFFLLCRAGGGLAAQTFHSRLSSALKKGKTLDEALEDGSSPGPQALRRVSAAASRNRSRILLKAAEALGLSSFIDTLGDGASFDGAPARGAVTSIECVVNSLRKVEGPARSIWQYSSGCVDAFLSSGVCCASNLASGFVLFVTKNNNLRISLRNDAHNSLPFATLRLAPSRDLASRIAQAHRRVAEGKASTAHPDDAFLKERFCWTSKNMGQRIDVEPPALWGSHASEDFLSSWGRELGVAPFGALRLAPQLVCVSAMEAAKLRAVVRSMED